MGQILRPFTNQLQPSGQVKPAGFPRIDWTHPITRGLTAYWYDTGAGVVELITGRRMVKGSNASSIMPVSGSTPFGHANKYNVDQANIEDPAIWSQQSWTAPYSAAVGFYQISAPESGSFSNWFGSVDASANDAFGFFCQTNGQIAINVSNDTPAVDVAITTGKFHAAAVAATGTSAQSNWLDGVPQASGSVTSAYTGTNEHHVIGGGGYGSSNTNNIGAAVFFGAVWGKRAITAAEAELLYTDPYCFLIYPETDLPAIYASSSGSTISGDAAAAGTSTAAAVSAAAAAEVAASAGIATAAAVSSALAAEVAAAAGVATVSGIGRALDSEVAASAGVATAAAISSALASEVASSAGVGTAAAISSALAAEVASSTGLGTASAVSSALAAEVASAAGVATAAAIGAALDSEVASSAGTSTAAATSAALASEVASSAGVSTAAATSSALAAEVASSAGVSTADATSSFTTGGAGDAASAGVATAAAVSSALASEVAASAGAATADATSVSTVTGDASSAGTSTADATSSFTQAGTTQAGFQGLLGFWFGGVGAITATTAAVVGWPSGGFRHKREDLERRIRKQRANTFSRRWFEEFLEAQEAALKKAEEVKSERQQKALVAAVEDVQGLEEILQESAARLTALLRGAANATRTSASIKNADRVREFIRLTLAEEEDDDEEAIELLLAA